MKLVHIDGFTVFNGQNLELAQGIRKKLCSQLREEFPNAEDKECIKEVLLYSLNHYKTEFETICKKENALEFYNTMFWLHEQATELRMDKAILAKVENEIDYGNYISVYRRVLKLILEQACLNNLNVEKPSKALKIRTEETFDKLMFLGDAMFTFSNYLAQIEMIGGDVVRFNYTTEGTYVYNLKPEFDAAFQKIVNFNNYEPHEYKVDEKAVDDFHKAVKKAFNFNFPDLVDIIFFLHEEKQVAQFVPLELHINGLWNNLKLNFPELDEEKTTAFLSGFYLTSENKLPIETVIRKPYSFDRILNRPILVWEVEGKKRCIIGKRILTDTLASLMWNSFPWNKAPKEWKENKVFAKFLEEKVKATEDILVDEVEERIKKTGAVYQRSVEKLNTAQGIVHIKKDFCGEIDILVLNLALKKIFVVECKHLLGRYDLPNYYLDFNSFTKGKDAFNKKIEKKVNWINANKDLIEQHFTNEKKLSSSLSDFTVEGVFIINTPTFYMYFSDFRIYTFHDVEKVITGTYVDKEYNIIIETEEHEGVMWIRYPYFKQKKIYFYEDPYADYPVDKYGNPIIPEGLIGTFI